MARLRQPLIHALIITLFAYAVTVGGTFGVWLPEARVLTLGLLAGGVGAWLLIRWRSGFRWHATPLDLAFALWGLAFAATLLLNFDSWRRMSLGFWHVGLYITVWYILTDLLSNGVLKRGKLIDTVLIGGGLVTIFSFVQMQGWATTHLPLMLSGAIPPELPRPGGLFGNANLLGSFYTVLIPLIIGRAAVTRGPGRVLLLLYGLVAAAMLFLTFSRGAWLSLAGALVFFALVLTVHIDLAAWWRTRTRFVRTGLVTTGAVLVAVILVMGALVAASFSQTGRAAGLRLSIYTAALDAYTSQPVAGTGLFTFGRALAAHQSMPPRNPHSHAHSIPFNVAAELGTLGLIALAVTVALILRQMWRNWHAAPSRREQILLLGGCTAALAFGLHHLVDLTAMLPGIALTGLFALVIALQPVEAQPVAAWRRPGHGIGVIALALALLVVSAWDVWQYRRYNDVLVYTVSTRDFRGGAEQLQPFIDTDPYFAWYPYQQGYLWGLAAATGDASARDEAIAAFERFTALEPVYATGWANLAALRWEAGDRDNAIVALQHAVERAPDQWSFAFMLGDYHETMGNADAARAAYEAALEAQPDAVFAPAWGATPLQVEVGAGAELSSLALTVRALEAGDVATAAAAWADHSDIVLTDETVAAVDAWLALAHGDVAAAERLLATAEVTATADSDRAWLGVVRAELARAAGDDAAAADRLASARARVAPDPFSADYGYGSNIPYIHFLRAAIQRQFVPPVYFPTQHPVLLHLLADT